ncbi:ParB/RepB/Spo0J family partition protein [Streptomyces sp. CA-250714]|uniref:ParB/RepB/Spo0J family partition protein n=1 Tax=Streptomyces sp. CA-250714 TaxID=3240060 RepID=UPI003D8CD014
MLRADEGTDTVELPLDALKAADSPRANGEDTAHTRALAETDAALPPILVHRHTMRVIDGMHRLRAAELRGAETITARFFDGDENAAFVLAVKSNVAHGLPLSLADRKAAALRIVTSHPQWSDRMIADATGLAHKTVGAIRRRLDGGGSQPVARVGRDGRVRPLSSGDGRLRASELLKKSPHATSEEIGLAAGISPTTVKDVRRRLQRGEDPLPSGRQRHGPDGSVEHATADHAPVERATLDHASAECASLDGVSAECASLDGVSAECASLDGVSAECAPLDGVSAERAPLDGVSAERARPDHARADQASSMPARPEEPRVPRARKGEVTRRRRPAAGVRSTDRAADLQRLRADPSVRFTESGRALLRWLDVGPRTVAEAVTLAGRVPDHHLGLIAALARQSAAMWQQLADELERRANAHTAYGG